ncbi:lipopolysaccharide assembly protein LapA domain-containing protein [Secundilactobacillus kimchicus]|uniref:lipopolysaccharide assembly protein LapA domain-containing protein n=1 Tax=Secundilactobacillus kimchicus TaxID=528209 RepID=UPI000705455E|nr:lipopolysaccharide assembly protein LapA domain-containing protein [Secundilactobacillus kimchicus]
MKRQIYIIIIILLIILISIFTIANVENVRVNFLVANFNIPLIILILLNLLIGAFLTFLVTSLNSLKIKKKIRALETSYQEKIDQQTKRLTKLRAENSLLTTRLKNSNGKQLSGQQQQTIDELSQQLESDKE